MKKNNDLNSRSLMLQMRQFAPAGLMFGLSIFLVVVTFRQLTSAYATSQSNRNLEKKVQEAESELAAVQSLASGDIVEQFDLAEKALPGYKPIFESLSDISSLAAVSGITVRDLSTRPGSVATEAAKIRTASSRSSSQAQEIKMTLEINGSFSSMMAFFRGLSDLLPLVDLAELRVDSRGGSSSTDSVFSGQMDLIIYWYPAPEIPKTLSPGRTTPTQTSLLDELQQLLDRQPVAPSSTTTTLLLPSLVIPVEAAESSGSSVPALLPSPTPALLFEDLLPQ